jgi:SAM-dependent methyltransferase
MTPKHRIADQVGGTYGSSEAATGWQRSGVVRAQTLTPLTNRMLDLAGVDVGHRVLDVAAGDGEQTILAAQRVGPAGTVLATDIAARMLALAEEAAARAAPLRRAGFGRQPRGPLRLEALLHGAGHAECSDQHRLRLLVLPEVLERHFCKRHRASVGADDFDQRIRILQKIWRRPGEIGAV